MGVIINNDPVTVLDYRKFEKSKEGRMKWNNFGFSSGITAFKSWHSKNPFFIKQYFYSSFSPSLIFQCIMKWIDFVIDPDRNIICWVCV